MRARLAVTVTALLLVLGGAVPSPPAAAVSVPDATAPGEHTVRVLDYDGGPVLFYGEGDELWRDRLQGTAFVPSGDGPFPVLLFLHGVSADCVEHYEDPVEREVRALLYGECKRRQPSHRGFDYIATNLASHGYLVVSVLTRSRAFFTVGGDAGSRERAEMLVRTLDLLATWHATPGPGAIGDALVGKVDLGRLGAMGHSRGGDGVTRLVEHARTRTDGPRYEVDAVIGLAQIDTGIAPHGIPFAVVLPMCDGDVRSMGGATTWDRGRFVDPAEPAPKSQFALRGANHLFFNTEWAEHDDTWRYDGVIDPVDSACSLSEPTNLRITAPEQQRIGLTLVAAFFRRYLGGERAFDPLMTGAAGLPAYACPDGLPSCPGALRTSYLAPAAGRRIVVSPVEPVGPFTRTDAGTPVRASGFADVRVCDPARATDRVGATAESAERLVRAAGRLPPDPAECPTDWTRSAARQVVLRWDGPAALGVPLGTLDARPYTALTFRTGVNVPEYGSSEPRVDVVLRDAAGRTATVTANDHTTALQAPDGSTTRRLVLNGVRIPLTAFHGVRLDRLTDVELRVGADGRGSIQLLELGFQVG